MSLRQKYLTILTQLAPAGAIGASLALGAAVPAAASTPPAGSEPRAAGPDSVAERLAAVRAAVSALDAGREDAAKDIGRLAWGNWGWGGGWGWPNWNNWHNWRNWGNWFRNW